MSRLELGIHPTAVGHWLALVAGLDHLDADGRGTPCQSDPAPFFSERRTDRAEAAEACRLGCPLLDLCARFADANGERHGVYGGVDRTPATRRRAATTEDAA